MKRKVIPPRPLALTSLPPADARATHVHDRADNCRRAGWAVHRLSSRSAARIRIEHNVTRGSRDQSIPSDSAGICAGVSDMTPSVPARMHRFLAASKLGRGQSRPRSPTSIGQLLDLKMTMVAENGSSPSPLESARLNHQPPGLKSTGLVAIRRRSPAGAAIMSPLPPALKHVRKSGDDTSFRANNCTRKLDGGHSWGLS
jgi:hypothetical protein